MATAAQPLLVLSHVRKQDEVRRAAIMAADAAYDRRRTVRAVFMCVLDYVVGLAAIALSVHISGDLAPVLFYAGLLRALGGPIWRVIICTWLEANG